MKIIEILYVVLISSVLLFLAVKYFITGLWSSLVRRMAICFKGKRTTGTITNAFESEDAGGTISFGMEVSYEDMYGNERTFRPDRRYSISPVVGEKVDVVYLPSDTEIAELYSVLLLFPPILSLLVIITACLVIILGLFRQFR